LSEERKWTGTTISTCVWSNEGLKNLKTLAAIVIAWLGEELDLEDQAREISSGAGDGQMRFGLGLCRWSSRSIPWEGELGKVREPWH